MRPRNPFLLLATALCLILSIACGKSEKTAAASATPAAPAATPTSLASASPAFGVPECDEYVRRYLACVDSKVPEAARAQVRQSLAQTQAVWDAWAKQLQSDADRAAMAQGCKTATEAARQAMAAYGCTF